MALAKKEFWGHVPTPQPTERRERGMRMGYKDAEVPTDCRRKGTDAALKVEGRIFPSSSHSQPLLWKIAISEKIAALSSSVPAQ